jgi:hypothetical protein
MYNKSLELSAELYSDQSHFSSEEQGVIYDSALQLSSMLCPLDFLSKVNGC